MNRLPPHLAVVQQLFDQMTKPRDPFACRHCIDGEREDGSLCPWCDPSGDVPDVTPEESERLRAIELGQAPMPKYPKF